MNSLYLLCSVDVLYDNLLFRDLSDSHAKPALQFLLRSAIKINLGVASRFKPRHAMECPLYWGRFLGFDQDIHSYHTIIHGPCSRVGQNTYLTSHNPNSIQPRSTTDLEINTLQRNHYSVLTPPSWLLFSLVGFIRHRTVLPGMKPSYPSTLVTIRYTKTRRSLDNPSWKNL